MPTEEFRTINYDNGDVYEGETLKSNASMRHGRGKYTYASGNRYEGDWVEGKRQGQGEFRWSSGGRYVGTFKDGKHQGYGTYYYDNGDIYDGEWSDGNFEGKGTFKWKDGTWYEGEWKADYMNGFGVAHWINGNRYEGEWKKDGSFGVGSHTTADGQVWKGEWYFEEHVGGAWQGRCEIANEYTGEQYSGHICRKKGELIFGHLELTEGAESNEGEAEPHHAAEESGDAQQGETYSHNTVSVSMNNNAELQIPVEAGVENVVSATAAEQTVECPICGGAFPLETIEEHANQCIESLG